MPVRTPTEITLAFVEAINAGNIEAIVDLMSEDHLFTDSLGAQIRGRTAMRSAWIAYALMIPDYRITVDHVLASGDVVALFGKAAGTFAPDGKVFPKNRWEIPAAWRAVVANQQVSEWQVYADNEPVRIIMNAGPTA